MTKGDIVWSSEEGDLRGKKSSNKENAPVNEAEVEILIRRMTTGKGRAVIELTGLPNNKNWCKKLAKNLKKTLAVGGAYKDDKIEVHGEKLEQVKDFMTKINLKFKQIGG